MIVFNNPSPDVLFLQGHLAPTHMADLGSIAPHDSIVLGGT